MNDSDFERYDQEEKKVQLKLSQVLYASGFGGTGIPSFPEDYPQGP